MHLASLLALPALAIAAPALIDTAPYDAQPDPTQVHITGVSILNHLAAWSCLPVTCSVLQTCAQRQLLGHLWWHWVSTRHSRICHLLRQDDDDTNFRRLRRLHWPRYRDY